jgi:hypothetical protein
MVRNIYRLCAHLCYCAEFYVTWVQIALSILKPKHFVEFYVTMYTVSTQRAIDVNYLSQVPTVLRRFNVVHVRMASTWTGLKQTSKRSSILKTKQRQQAVRQQRR